MIQRPFMIWHTAQNTLVDRQCGVISIVRRKPVRNRREKIRCFDCDRQMRLLP